MDALYDVETLQEWSTDEICQQFIHGNLKVSKKEHFEEFYTDWQISLSPNTLFLAIFGPMSLEIRSRTYNFSKEGSRSFSKTISQKSNQRTAYWCSNSQYVSVAESFGQLEIFNTQAELVYSCNILDCLKASDPDSFVSKIFDIFNSFSELSILTCSFSAEDTIFQKKLWKFRLFFILKDGVTLSILWDGNESDEGEVCICHIASIKQHFNILSAAKSIGSSLYFLAGMGKSDSTEISSYSQKVSIFEFHFFSHSFKVLNTLILPSEKEEANSFFRHALQSLWTNETKSDSWPMTVRCSFDLTKAIILKDHKEFFVISIEPLKLLKKFKLSEISHDDLFQDSGSQVILWNWWSNNILFIATSKDQIILLDLNSLTILYSKSTAQVGVVCSVSSRLSESPIFFLCKASNSIKFPISNKSIDFSTGRLVSIAEPLDLSSSNSFLAKLKRYAFFPFTFVTDTFLWSFDSSKRLPSYQVLSIPSFSLLKIYKTNPVDHYRNLLKDKKFNEALEISLKYDLDEDEAYKCIWLDSPVSEISIRNYLSKIKDTAWVLNSCLTRKVELPSTLRLLLSFAHDLVSNLNLASSNLTLSVSDDSDAQNDLLKKALEVLSALRKLKCFDQLALIDSLDPYAFIKEFSEFRVKENLLVSLEFAKTSRFKFLEIMFMNFTTELLPHRYKILEAIPETCNPEDFQMLLPGIENEAEIFLCFSSDYLKEIESGVTSPSNYYYPLPKEAVVSWYKSRILYVDEHTGLVDHLHLWLEICQRKCHVRLDAFQILLDSYSDFVYFCGSMTVMREFENLDPVQIVYFYLLSSNLENFKMCLDDKIGLFCKQRRISFDKTVSEAVTKAFEINTNVCLAIFKLEWAKESTSMANALINCLFMAQESQQNELIEISRNFRKIDQSELLQLNNLVSVANLLAKYQLDYKLIFLKENIQNDFLKQQIIDELLSLPFLENCKDARWIAVYNDLISFRKFYAKNFEMRRISASFISALLKHKKFYLALSLLFPKDGEKMLNDTAVASLLLSHCHQIVDSCSILDKNALEDARNCLQVAQHMTTIQVEIDLIDGLAIIGQLVSDIPEAASMFVPFEIRNSGNRSYFLLKLIDIHPKLYQSDKLCLDILGKIYKNDEEAKLSVYWECLKKATKMENDVICFDLLDKIYSMPISNSKGKWRLLEEYSKRQDCNSDKINALYLRCLPPYQLLDKISNAVSTLVKDESSQIEASIAAYSVLDIKKFSNPVDLNQQIANLLDSFKGETKPNLNYPIWNIHKSVSAAIENENTVLKNIFGSHGVDLQRLKEDKKFAIKCLSSIYKQSGLDFVNLCHTLKLDFTCLLLEILRTIKTFEDILQLYKQYGLYFRNEIIYEYLVKEFLQNANDYRLVDFYESYIQDCQSNKIQFKGFDACKYLLETSQSASNQDRLSILQIGLGSLPIESIFSSILGHLGLMNSLKFLLILNENADLRQMYKIVFEKHQIPIDEIQRSFILLNSSNAFSLLQSISKFSFLSKISISKLLELKLDILKYCDKQTQLKSRISMHLHACKELLNYMELALNDRESIIEQLDRVWQNGSEFEELCAKLYLEGVPLDFIDLMCSAESIEVGSPVSSESPSMVTVESCVIYLVSQYFDKSSGNSDFIKNLSKFSSATSLLSILWSRLEQELSKSLSLDIKQKIYSCCINSPFYYKNEAELLKFFKLVKKAKCKNFSLSKKEDARLAEIEDASKIREIWGVEISNKEEAFAAAFCSSKTEADFYELFKICAKWPEESRYSCIKKISRKMISLEFNGCLQNLLLEYPQALKLLEYDYEAFFADNLDSFKIVCILQLNGNESLFEKYFEIHGNFVSSAFSSVDILGITGSSQQKLRKEILILIFCLDLRDMDILYKMNVFETMLNEMQEIASLQECFKIFLLKPFLLLIINGHFALAAKIAKANLTVPKAFLLLSDPKYMLRNAIQQLKSPEYLLQLSNLNRNIQLKEWNFTRIFQRRIEENLSKIIDQLPHLSEIAYDCVI